MPCLRGRGDEQAGDAGPGGERFGNSLRALRQEGPLTLPQRPLGQPPGGAQPRRADPAVVAVRQAAAVSGSACLATSTSAANAASSVTARSARTFLSTSTPAALRPCTNRL